MLYNPGLKTVCLKEMQMCKWFLALLMTTVLCLSEFSEAASADGPVYKLDGKGFITEWIVTGAFPSPEVDEQPDGSSHLGFYKDYLQSLGGETQAAITEDTLIEYTDESGATRSLRSEVVASDSGIVDLDAMFGNPDNVMAYAFCYIDADETQVASFSLGSDDAVKVWVNGELAHSNYVGRVLTLGQDTFKAPLRQGKNRVLVKIVDWVRDWGFAVEVFDEEASAAEEERQRQKQAFIDSQIAREEILWPNGIANNPISYAQEDIMKTGSWHPDAPLQISRAYSNVATPTYHVYPAPPEKNTGVGIVILPGGGYNDVWIDAEGHSIALHFQEQGITSMVVKYRTNSRDENGERPMSREAYLPAATADANEGIRILRSRAKELNLDPNKIGVGGFSAGAHLSLSVCVNPDKEENFPDFACLIYPWLQKNSNEQVSQAEGLPPMFIVNGQEDTATPADLCAQFYYTLCQKKVPAELHIYTKGTHGFSLGLGQGHSTVQWPGSFVAWLKDINMIEED
jgi:acetyl esterase/lipase